MSGIDADADPDPADTEPRNAETDGSSIPLVEIGANAIQGVVDVGAWDYGAVYGDDADAVLVDIDRLAELVERARAEFDAPLVNVIVEDERPLAIVPAEEDPERGHVLVPKMRPRDDETRASPLDAIEDGDAR